MFRTPVSNRRAITKPEYNDVFPLLPVNEISICLQGCDFTAPQELLMRPTPQYIQSLFEQILDSFMGVSTHNLGSMLMEAATAADVETESLHINERILMKFALQRKIYRFLLDCGIDDFSGPDLVKPDPQRIQRILSGVVNFARFREEHMNDCDVLVQRNEQDAEQYQIMPEKLDALAAKIENIELKNAAKPISDPAERLRNIEANNSNVEFKLRQLKKVQEQLMLEHSEYRTEKARLIAKLQDVSFLILEGRKGTDSLRPYIIESPEMLHQVYHDLEASLATKQPMLEEARRRVRRLGTGTNNILHLQEEGRNIINIIDKIEDDQREQKDVARKVAQMQGRLETLKLDAHQLEPSILQNARQIELRTERFKNLQKQSEDRKAAAKTKKAEVNMRIEELKIQYSKEAQEIENQLSIIAEKEKEMVIMQIELEEDLRRLAMESERLNAHIESYFNDMERKIASSGSISGSSETSALLNFGQV